jgi:hypothetical protein
MQVKLENEKNGALLRPWLAGGGAVSVVVGNLSFKPSDRISMPAGVVGLNTCAPAVHLQLLRGC